MVRRNKKKQNPAKKSSKSSTNHSNSNNSKSSSSLPASNQAANTVHEILETGYEISKLTSANSPLSAKFSSNKLEFKRQTVLEDLKEQLEQQQKINPDSFLKHYIEKNPERLNSVSQEMISDLSALAMQGIHKPTKALVDKYANIYWGEDSNSKNRKQTTSESDSTQTQTPSSSSIFSSSSTKNSPENYGSFSLNPLEKYSITERKLLLEQQQRELEYKKKEATAVQNYLNKKTELAAATSKDPHFNDAKTVFDNLAEDMFGVHKITVYRDPAQKNRRFETVQYRFGPYISPLIPVKDSEKEMLDFPEITSFEVNNQKSEVFIDDEFHVTSSWIDKIRQVRPDLVFEEYILFKQDEAIRKAYKEERAEKVKKRRARETERSKDFKAKKNQERERDQENLKKSTTSQIPKIQYYCPEISFEDPLSSIVIQPGSKNKTNLHQLSDYSFDLFRYYKNSTYTPNSFTRITSKACNQGELFDLPKWLGEIWMLREDRIEFDLYQLDELIWDALLLTRMTNEKFEDLQVRKKKSKKQEELNKTLEIGDPGWAPPTTYVLSDKEKAKFEWLKTTGYYDLLIYVSGFYGICTRWGNKSQIDNRRRVFYWFWLVMFLIKFNGFFFR